MFLLDNFWLVILIGVFFFIAFTYVNIYAEINEGLSSLFCTIVFLYSFIKTPLMCVNMIYNIDKDFLDQFLNEKQISQEKQKKIKKVIRNRISIFWVLSRSGMFSYRSTMSSVIRGIQEDPEVFCGISERILKKNVLKFKDNIDSSDLIRKFV